MRPRRTFGQKLQLSISTLLCLVVAAVAWAAHRQMQRVLVQSTRERIEATTREASNIVGESARRVQRDTRDSSTHADILAALRDPTPAHRAAAEALLTERRERSAVLLSLTIVDRSNTPVAMSGVSVIPASPLVPGFGPLVNSDSGVVYRNVTPIVAASDTLGFIVSNRRVSSPVGAKQLNDIIGDATTLRLGNADGAFWSDMVRPTVAPPTGDDAFVERLAVPNTPWLVAVYANRAEMLAPAREFLWQIVLISLVFVALGSLLAWALSVQTTAPLAELTRAAEDVSRGDYDRRVMVTGAHELSSLAASFNTMAQQVGSSTEALGRHARELEAANAELRESEERYRRLVEAAHEGICTVDVQGVITYANARLAEMLGVAAGALTGRSWFDLLAPERAAEARSDFARRRLGIAESQEVALRRADGETVHALQSMSSLFDGQGEFTGALYMLSDVTDRHTLQAQLIQSQKMEAVGQLAGGIAHDFNNLLTVVTSYSALLLSELPVEGEHRRDVQEIADAAERAAALTRQLLAFSRRQVLQPRLVDLNTIVSNIERMLGRVLREDIRLETAFAPELGSVFADPGQLEQVLVNLAVNARDAMPMGGTLTIRTSNVEVTGELVRRHPEFTPGSYVLLAVADTGVGMDAGTRARIFEPFFTTKAAGHGTGLGLSTVYGIARQTGGFVTVESAPGEGTTFLVYLPRAQAPAVQAEAKPASVPDARGEGTVLLVEDETPVRAVARRILERAGYTVLEATSGVDALRLFEDRGGEVDVLVTDMVMPEVGGRELASRLRARRPSLKTIFMSGYTEDSVLQRGEAESGVAFVQKPFTSRTLTERVREAVSLRRLRT